jgi:ADP-heptose:LPS heptosyltransferase
MSTILDRLPAEARVAVIRLRSLGDCVLTTPALHLLKSARPDLKLTVIVEDAFAAVFDGNPDVETIMPPNTGDIARLHPELVLNLHGGNRSAQMTFASRARLRAGFTHYRFSALYNVRIPRAQQILKVDHKVHTAEHMASAAFYLGAPAGPIPRAKLFATPSTRGGEAYAVLHPVASAPEKTWPAANFKKVAEHLKHELKPIFIAGPTDNLADFGDYECIVGAPLGKIKSLLAGASLFIGNDSGPAHMAAAFGLPCVVLFGPSDHEIWSPWKTESVVLKSADIAAIEVSQVLDAVQRLCTAARRAP